MKLWNSLCVELGMKVLILECNYAKALRVANSVREAEFTKTGNVAVRDIDSVPRTFIKGEFEIVPPELENEPIEVIKLYFAL